MTFFAVQLFSFKAPITTEYPLINILDYEGKEWANLRLIVQFFRNHSSEYFHIHNWNFKELSYFMYI